MLEDPQHFLKLELVLHALTTPSEPPDRICHWSMHRHSTAPWWPLICCNEESEGEHLAIIHEEHVAEIYQRSGIPMFYEKSKLRLKTCLCSGKDHGASHPYKRFCLHAPYSDLTSSTAADHLSFINLHTHDWFKVFEPQILNAFSRQ